jgi:hypothetical protein
MGIRRSLVALLCAWLAGSVQAQLIPDPGQPWQTADSAHFRIHYRAAQRGQAEAVAAAAERIYGKVTQALQWQPRSRTEIVVYSELDQANGFTTPLPFSLIGVFLAPPDRGELLDNSPWLDLLLVHEFTHAVQLDKVRGAPRVLQAIFGNVPWFIPNLWQPAWGLEGLAVFNESEPAAGRGRLQGPWFEAWLRAERERGFIGLRELNADGRRLPLSKQYLYGAYFYEFLARRYGADKPAALVQQYSGNIVPRLHSAPWDATGKMMDELWEEFLADLAQQVDQRAAAIKAQPEVLGARLLAPQFEIGAVAALPDGAVLAVVDDGLQQPQLRRLQPDGGQQVLAGVNRDARIAVGAQGQVLLTQPDLCRDHAFTHSLAYDLYRLEGDRLQALTDCAHLRRAVPLGADALALQLQAGKTRLVRVTAGGEIQPLHEPADGNELLDLAAAPDGSSVAVIDRRGGDWRVLAFDLAQPGNAPKLLLRRGAPLQSLTHGPAGLELVAIEAGQANVWRLQGGEFRRLTHSHTAVLAQAGSAADGSLATVVVAPGGQALYRLPTTSALQSLPADTGPAPAAPASNDAQLGDGQPYAAWRSLYPRAWLPLFGSDRGLTTLGASTSGGDALGWHQYAAALAWETSQKEPLGSLEYLFLGQHSLALSRTLSARAWTGGRNDEDITVYDRRTKLQWLSRLPWLSLERRVQIGLGAALDRIDQVYVPFNSVTRPQDERLVAALLDWDAANGNWLSEGPNRGFQATLLAESYKPLAKNGRTSYDGSLLRTDLRGYLGLGTHTLAVRFTDVAASGNTEPFQLGGATDELLQFGPVLNNRRLSLRGYSSNLDALQGRNARVGSVEWRLPLADIDRMAMVPPVGINRLSATVFFDIGGAWSSGNSPAQWYRGVGVELLGEVKLLYALGLQLRLGWARGLDGPKENRGYLSLGRAF